MPHMLDTEATRRAQHTTWLLCFNFGPWFLLHHREFLRMPCRKLLIWQTGWCFEFVLLAWIWVQYDELKSWQAQQLHVLQCAQTKGVDLACHS